MRSVTVFCPLATTGAGEFVVHTTGGVRLVVDCKVAPLTLLGHVRITLGPEISRDGVGRVGGADKRLARAM
jgi:hypothetical protein